MTSSMIGKGSLAVGLMLTMAASAAAQDTTRTRTDTLRPTSTQRIPVTKESSARRTQTSTGEVRLTRDSAMIRDSIARRLAMTHNSSSTVTSNYRGGRGGESNRSVAEAGPGCS